MAEACGARECREVAISVRNRLCAARWALVRPRRCPLPCRPRRRRRRRPQARAAEMSAPARAPCATSADRRRRRARARDGGEQVYHGGQGRREHGRAMVPDQVSPRNELAEAAARRHRLGRGQRTARARATRAERAPRAPARPRAQRRPGARHAEHHGHVRRPAAGDVGARGSRARTGARSGGDAGRARKKRDRPRRLSPTGEAARTRAARAAATRWAPMRASPMRNRRACVNERLPVPSRRRCAHAQYSRCAKIGRCARPPRRLARRRRLRRRAPAARAPPQRASRHGSRERQSSSMPSVAVGKAAPQRLATARSGAGTASASPPKKGASILLSSARIPVAARSSAARFSSAAPRQRSMHAAPKRAVDTAVHSSPSPRSFALQDTGLRRRRGREPSLRSRRVGGRADAVGQRSPTSARGRCAREREHAGATWRSLQLGQPRRQVRRARRHAPWRRCRRAAGAHRGRGGRRGRRGERGVVRREHERVEVMRARRRPLHARPSIMLAPRAAPRRHAAGRARASTPDIGRESRGSGRRYWADRDVASLRCWWSAGSGRKVAAAERAAATLDARSPPHPSTAASALTGARARARMSGDRRRTLVEKAAAPRRIGRPRPSSAAADRGRALCDVERARRRACATAAVRRVRRAAVEGCRRPSGPNSTARRPQSRRGRRSRKVRGGPEMPRGRAERRRRSAVEAARHLSRTTRRRSERVAVADRVGRGAES